MYERIYIDVHPLVYSHRSPNRHIICWLVLLPTFIPSVNLNPPAVTSKYSYCPPHPVRHTYLDPCSLSFFGSLPYLLPLSCSCLFRLTRSPSLAYWCSFSPPRTFFHTFINLLPISAYLLVPVQTFTHPTHPLSAHSQLVFYATLSARQRDDKRNKGTI